MVDENRDEMISFRAARRERTLIEAAAAAKGKSLSEYLRTAAVQVARNELSAELANGG